MVWGLRNVQQFRGGLVFKAHRLLYHSTLGLRAIKKKKKGDRDGKAAHAARGEAERGAVVPRRRARNLFVPYSGALRDQLNT